MKLALIERKINVQHGIEGLVINEMNNSISEENLIRSVMQLLIRLMDSVNCKQLSGDAIILLSSDILEKMKYESLEDIVLMLKMGRQGDFGKNYQSIDSTLICGEWFPAYMDKKSEAIEINHKNKMSEHANIKTDNKSFAEGISKLSHQLRMDAIKSKNNKINSPIVVVKYKCIKCNDGQLMQDCKSCKK